MSSAITAVETNSHPQQLSVLDNSCAASRRGGEGGGGRNGGGGESRQRQLTAMESNQSRNEKKKRKKRKKKWHAEEGHAALPASPPSPNSETLHHTDFASSVAQRQLRSKWTKPDFNFIFCFVCLILFRFLLFFFHRTAKTDQNATLREIQPSQPLKSANSRTVPSWNHRNSWLILDI